MKIIRKLYNLKSYIIPNEEKTYPFLQTYLYHHNQLNYNTQNNIKICNFSNLNSTIYEY